MVASGCFALGATFQHLGVERNLAGAESRAMTGRRFLQLLRTPLWLGGTALLGVGAATHVVALGMAPLTVIQPVGILAVPFSILLANRIFHRRTTLPMWGMVAMTVLGIVVFTVLSGLTAVEHSIPGHRHAIMASLVVFVLAFGIALFAAKGPRWMASLAWAWSGAFLYGLGSAFIKMILATWTKGHHPVLWVSIVGLALAYAVGAWIIQQAYATGPAEVVVGVMTTVDPMIAVVFGLVVLGEGRRIGLGIGALMVLAAALSACGVFLLSKYHPEAIKHREEKAKADGATVVEQKG